MKIEHVCQQPALASRCHCSYTVGCCCVIQVLLLSSGHRDDHMTTVRCVHNADVFDKARVIAQVQRREKEQGVTSLQRSNTVHSLKTEIQNF